MDLFAPIATLGLDAIIVQMIAQDSSDKAAILGTAFSMRILSSILAISLSIIIVLLLNPEDALIKPFVIVLCLGFIPRSLSVIDAWFQANLQAKKTVISQNLSYFTSISLQALMVLKQMPFLLLGWVRVFEVFLTSLGLLALYQRSDNFLVWRFDAGICRKMLRQSAPLVVSALSIAIYLRMDQVMLGQMLGTREVGIYSAATKLSESWYFLPMALCSSYAPSIFAAKKSSEKAYLKKVKRLLDTLVFLSLSSSLLLTIFSNKIVTILFGSEYTDASRILSVHVWASLFVFMGVGTSQWLMAEDLNHISMYRTVCGACINISLNLILIPIYSGFGAAIATLASYSFSAFFFHAIHPKTRVLFLNQLRSIISLGIPSVRSLFAR